MGRGDKPTLPVWVNVYSNGLTGLAQPSREAANKRRAWTAKRLCVVKVTRANELALRMLGIMPERIET